MQHGLGKGLHEFPYPLSHGTSSAKELPRILDETALEQAIIEKQSFPPIFTVNEGTPMRGLFLSKISNLVLAVGETDTAVSCSSQIVGESRVTWGLAKNCGVSS